MLVLKVDETLTREWSWMDGWMDEGEIDGCMFYHLSIYHDGEIHAVQLEQSGLPASLCLLVSLEPK